MPETDKEKKAKKAKVRPAKIGVDPNIKPNITKKTGYAESVAANKDTEFQMYENPDYLIQNKIGRTGYWNAFQDYLKNYKLPNGENYVGNEAANINLANDNTNRVIADYNKSLLEKYKDKPEVAQKMAISLDDVAQVQDYYYQGNPRVKRDRIIGGDTSQFRFPSSAFVDVDKAKEGEFIPVIFGGKQYVIPADSYNNGIGIADYVEYDPSVHQNIDPNYVKTLNKIRGGQAGGAFVVPEAQPTNITPVAATANTPNATASSSTMTQGVTAPQGAITAPSVSNKAVRPVAPRMTTSPTGEIIYEGMDDPKYDAIKKENARKRAMSIEANPTPTVLPTSEDKAPMIAPQNKAKGGKIMAPKMKKYVNAGVVQVPGSQGQTNTGNVPLTQEQIDAKKAKNDALVSQLGSAAMTIGNQLNQQPIDYSASEKQRQNADVANVAADQALSATVPYYGLVKGASDIIGSMAAKDKYGEAKSGINAAIKENSTSVIETAINEGSKGNVLGVMRETSGLGRLGRTAMQVIGKGDETKGFFGDVNKALGTTDRKIAGEKYMAEQLAEAKAKDTAYKQSQAVANRDAGILEGAQVQGLYDLSSPEYDENRQLILKPGYAKGGVIGAAKMMYAKGGTIVGKGGPKDDAIFTKANKEGIEPGSFIVPAENNEKAKGIRAALFGNENQIAQFKKGGKMKSNVAVSDGEHWFTRKERKKIINRLGEEILEELAPNAEENSESENEMAMAAQGGMIKRAKRGLWDNIRDAAGSGKQPTAEMLKQEKKIKAEYYNGGIIPVNVASQKRTEQIQDSYAEGGTTGDGLSKDAKMYGGKIMAPKMKGYAMGTDVEGVEDVPVSKKTYADVSNKTYAELITPPTTWRGTKEAYKAAVDKSIKEGKTIPKGGVMPSLLTPTAEVKSEVKAAAVKGDKKGEKVPKSVRFDPKKADENFIKAGGDTEDIIVPGVPVPQYETDFTDAIEPYDKNPLSKEDAQKLFESTWKYDTKNNPNAIKETSPKAPRKGLADYVKNIDPGAAFSAYQIGQGSKLLKSGQRPEDVSKIDPAYNAAVERAQRDATFGYTPEQAAMLDQKAINALNDARFAGKNLASGSGTTAFLQERQAINQGWSNALQLKSADQQLRMQKQQYADQAVKERADFLDMQRRRAFGDAMNTYNVNQESGSALVGAGVRNAIGAFRYQKELEAQERAAKIAGMPITTG